MSMSAARFGYTAQAVVAVRRCREPLLAKAEQIIFSHEPQDALVICLDALPMQLFGDAAITVTRTVQGNPSECCWRSAVISLLAASGKRKSQATFLVIASAGDARHLAQSL